MTTPAPHPLPSQHTVPVRDAVHALAFIGDLSMGQPTDHSLRTAWLAGRIAEAAGRSAAVVAAVQQVSLLRWSGCTANAPEFSELLGDDVGGRAVMLARQPEDVSYAFVVSQVQPLVPSLAAIHCEVSGDIARMLGVAPEVEHALRFIFEHHDGSGPAGLRHDQVPPGVGEVSLASDLEIFARVQGLPRAQALIAARSGAAYPADLTDTLDTRAAGWMEQLNGDDWRQDLAQPDVNGVLNGVKVADATIGLELVADVIDLKLPWMTGHSRRVAEAAGRTAAALGMSAVSQERCYRAGLVHGMGRAAVPNAVWNTPGPLRASAREQVRLAPYWTARAARQIGGLAADAEVASHVGERLDGSGSFRGCTGAAMPPEGRVLAAAAAWVALRSARPWRAAWSHEQARERLQAEAQAGRFDADAVQALAGLTPAATSRLVVPDPLTLTEREAAVFRCISLGHTNKEAARQLDISPSTVRTHVENVFRKLGCTTRAAATLRAVALGLL